MKIIELLDKKSKNIYENKPITIAFLGDSVTQGCYECYLTSPTSLETVFDVKNAYSTRIREMLNILYPNVQINIINSGLSGDGTIGGNQRFNRDIAPFNPDLVVVSFGLNDSCGGEENIKNYIANLTSIFDKVEGCGAECIFLTQNYMCNNVSPHLKDELFINLAKNFTNIQENGILKKYFESAKELCAIRNIKVCDLYAVWEKLSKGGVNTTELLSNKLNHPVREFHYYMAIKLIETMFEK